MKPSGSPYSARDMRFGTVLFVEVTRRGSKDVVDAGLATVCVDSRSRRHFVLVKPRSDLDEFRELHFTANGWEYGMDGSVTAPHRVDVYAMDALPDEVPTEWRMTTSEKLTCLDLAICG